MHPDKGFPLNNYVMRHMRMHTGDKPYQGNKYDKVFLQNSDLLKYLRIHTGEKLYQCSQCGNAFS